MLVDVEIFGLYVSVDYDSCDGEQAPQNQAVWLMATEKKMDDFDTADLRQVTGSSGSWRQACSIHRWSCSATANVERITPTQGCANVKELGPEVPPLAIDSPCCNPAKFSNERKGLPTYITPRTSRLLTLLLTTLYCSQIPSATDSPSVLVLSHDLNSSIPICALSYPEARRFANTRSTCR